MLLHNDVNKAVTCSDILFKEESFLGENVLEQTALEKTYRVIDYITSVEILGNVGLKIFILETGLLWGKYGGVKDI